MLSIYALGNIVGLSAALTGFSALVTSSFYKNLFVLLLTIALFLRLCNVSFSKENPFSLLKYLLCAIIINGLLFQATTSVAVVESTGKQGAKETHVVDKVPFIIALPLSALSTFGYEGAALVYRAYRIAGSLSLPEGYQGFSPLAQLVKDASTYTIQDRFLRRSLMRFIRDCEVPLFYKIGNERPDFLTKSIWPEIVRTKGGLSQFMRTVNFGTKANPIPAGDLVSCPDAYTKINTALSTWGNAQPLGKTLGLTKKVTAGIMGKSLFSQVLAGGDNAAEPNPGDYIKQAALLHMMSNDLPRYMTVRSNPAALSHWLASESATHTIISHWYTSGETYLATMGYVMAILQIVIIGVAPFILLSLVFPHAGKTLGHRYLVLLAWIPACYILDAITNVIMMNLLTVGLGDIFSTTHGLTSNAQTLISVKLQHLQAVSQFANALVPMIAYGIVGGLQMPITSILSHSGALTSGAEAGRAAATGNLSLDNQSFDNINANKHSMTHQVDLGSRAVVRNLSGSNELYRRDFGGEGFHMHDGKITAQHTDADTDTSVDSETVSQLSSINKQLIDSHSSVQNSMTGWGQVDNHSQGITKYSGVQGSGVGAAAMAALMYSRMGADDKAFIKDSAASAGYLFHRAAAEKAQGHTASAKNYYQQAKAELGQAVKHFEAYSPPQKAAIIAGITLAALGTGGLAFGVAAGSVAGMEAFTGLMGMGVADEGAASLIGMAAGEVTAVTGGEGGAAAVSSALRSMATRAGLGAGVAASLMKGFSVTAGERMEISDIMTSSKSTNYTDSIVQSKIESETKQFNASIAKVRQRIHSHTSTDSTAFPRRPNVKVAGEFNVGSPRSDSPLVKTRPLGKSGNSGGADKQPTYAWENGLSDERKKELEERILLLKKSSKKQNGDK